MIELAMFGSRAEITIVTLAGLVTLVGAFAVVYVAVRFATRRKPH